MVVCMRTDRLWRKALESLRSSTGLHWWPVTRSCICIRILVFVFVFVQGPGKVAEHGRDALGSVQAV